MNTTINNPFDESFIDRKVKFYLDDGTLFTGKITGIPNEEHVTVLVDHKYDSWPWMVRSEAIMLV